MNADFISSSMAIGMRLPPVGGGGGVAAPSALMFGPLAWSTMGRPGGLLLGHRASEFHRAGSVAEHAGVLVRQRRFEHPGGAVGRRQREAFAVPGIACLLYTSPSPRDS